MKLRGSSCMNLRHVLILDMFDTELKTNSYNRTPKLKC